MKTEDLNQTEKSLLLFLETAAVDHGGLYKPVCVNDEDREIMDRWRDAGFIDHGRVASEFLSEYTSVWVRLSPKAMTLAHQLRWERAERMWDTRYWWSTAEKREAQVQGAN